MPSLLPSPSIDFSRLPAPDVIETLSYEAILAEHVALLQAYDPQFTAIVESDPAYKALQVGAYRELLIRQRINEAGHAVMLPYAKGADLDNLAALFGVTRLVRVEADPENDIAEVLEGDDDLRERVLLAPDSYSVAGPAGAYVYHARSAPSGQVGDATAISPDPGDVVVTVLRWDGDGSAEQDLLDEVNAIVNADTVRPLTDRVTVQSAEIEEFEIDIDLYVFDGPDRQIVVDEARASLERWLTLNRRLGRDKPLSAITAAAHVAGVQRLVINSPPTGLVHDATQASHCTGITLRIAGTDE